MNIRTRILCILSAISIVGNISSADAARLQQTSPKLIFKSKISNTSGLKFPRLASSPEKIYLAGTSDNKSRLWSKSTTAEKFPTPTDIGTTSGKDDYISSGTALAADGTAYQIWNYQNKGIYIRSIAPNGALGETHAVHTGNIFRAFPDIGVTTDGTLIAAWYAQESGATSERYYASISHDHGASWTAPQMLATAQATNQKVFVATGPNNSAAITFGSNNLDIYVATFNGSTFDTEIVATREGKDEHKQYAQPCITIDTSGSIYVAWRTVFGEIYYAKRSGSSSWSKQLVISQSKKIDALGVGISADSHNNVHITWSIEQQGNPIYYAFIGADGSRSITHTDSGGYNPTVSANIQGLSYAHIAYEVFDGDAPHTEYLLYSHDSGPVPISEPHATPIIENGIATTTKTNVTVTFQNVSNSPTQVRWKWNAVPTDSTTDSNGWQTYASSLNIPLPTDASACQSQTLYTQVRNAAAVESTPGQGSIMLDNAVQAGISTINPHRTTELSSYAQGVEGGDPTFTREDHTTLQIVNNDCSGLATYQIGSQNVQQWPSSTLVITQNVNIDTSAPGLQNITGTIADTLGNSDPYSASVIYDPSDDGKGAPQYQAGELQVSTDNKLIREITLQNVQVTDTIYQEATGKPFWGIWVAVNPNLFTPEQINNVYSPLRWTAIPITNPGQQFSASISLASGQGKPNVYGLEGTYYIYVKFLDGAGNASSNTIISAPVQLTKGYQFPQTFFPILTKN